jgi:amylosucrase
LDGYAHRRFLSDFYSGEFAGTFARGLVFQENPKTHDRRISGSGASLAGLEAALEQQDNRQIELSVKRLLLMHAIIFSFGGIPLLYMGDEIALLNDHSFLQNPEMAMDNRWVHRPAMPECLAPESSAYGQAQRRMQAGIQQLIEARIRTPHLHAAIESRVLEPHNPHVFVFERQHPLGRLVCLFNFSETAQAVQVDLTSAFDLITQTQQHLESGVVWLSGYQALWLVQHPT